MSDIYVDNYILINFELCIIINVGCISRERKNNKRGELNQIENSCLNLQSTSIIEVCKIMFSQCVFIAKRTKSHKSPNP